MNNLAITFKMTIDLEFFFFPFFKYGYYPIHCFSPKLYFHASYLKATIISGYLI